MQLNRLEQARFMLFIFILNQHSNFFFRKEHQYNLFILFFIVSIGLCASSFLWKVYVRYTVTIFILIFCVRILYLSIYTCLQRKRSKNGAAVLRVWNRTTNIGLLTEI